MTTQQNTSGEGAGTAIHFPIRLLTIVWVLTTITIAWFGWITFDLSRGVKAFRDQSLRIEELRGVIVHLDEVLTMSARMAAATGDPKWEVRYRLFDPQLDAAIKETVGLGTSLSSVKTAAKTDEANIKLVEMENRAFALVRAGRKEEAQAVLFSPEYEAQKQIYADGINSFSSQIRREADERERQDKRIDSLSMIGALVVLAISLAAWLSVPRSLQRWRADLEQAVSRRQQAEQALQRANETLEARIRQRTAELEKTNQILQAEIIERKKADTDRRQSEEALRRSETKFRTLFDSTGDAVMLLDKKGFFDCNPAALAMIGCASREEFLSKHPADVSPPTQPDGTDSLTLAKRQIAMALEKGSHQFEWMHKRADTGEVFPADVLLSTMELDGKPVLQAVVRDTTERKLAEEGLKLFRALIDHSSDGIYVMDPATRRFLDVNESGCRALGYTRDELLALTALDVSAEGDRASLDAADTQMEKAGRAMAESLHRRKDGTTYPVEASLSHVTLDREYLVAIVRDITERKRAEETLRASKQIIEGIINAIPARVFWKDKNLVYLGCNSVFARDAGFADSKDIIGKDDFQMGWHDQAEKYRRDDRQVIESGCPKLLIEEPQTTPEGKTITLLSSKIALRSPDGQISGILGTYMDITERKELEARMERLRTEQALILNSLGEGVHWIDVDGRIKFENPAAAKMLGYEVSELIGKPAHSTMHHTRADGTAYPQSDCYIYATLTDGVPRRVTDEVFWRKDGTSFAVEYFCTPVCDPNGGSRGCVVIFADITERRRAEETLASEQQLLNGLIAATPDHIYFKDRECRFIRINEGFARRNGFSDPSKALGKTDFDIFGEHAGVAYADEQRIIATGQPMIDKEEREDWKDGRVTWVASTKMPMRDSAGKIVGIMGISRDITERRRAEESLRLLGSAVEQAEESIHITDAQLDPPGPRLLFVNPAFTRITGYSAEEVLGKTPRILQGEHTDKTVLARLRATLARGEAFHGEVLNYRKDGSEFHSELHITPIRDPSGILTHFVAIMRDITERRRFEERLFQSQKMETVGKLAGGIAHEFNSIMTAIIGQSELMLYDLPAGNPLRKNASEIHQAADRAAALTRQLLAYGRKQILQPDVLDLNHVLAGMENTLRHLAGRDVDVRIVSPPGPMLVKADAGQIEQVIVNIVMNAADAMPNGGKLTLETAGALLDQQYASHFPDLKPGGYVMLAVTDTGAGMSEAVKARLFEPFFTTKDVGKGTGLGLATCHGIIKQSGGHINVYSEPGRGATFKIYLPTAQMETGPPAPPLQSPGLPRGTETILLVEDDPALREMAAALLGRLGYTVLTAGNGLEALNVTHQRATGHIDLLFTDVVMPHMSGKELSDRIQALYPRTKILFTSAYTETAIVHQGVLNPGVSLLQKPFTPSALANKVREVLDLPSQD